MRVTQRQATLGILAVHALGAILFLLSDLFQPMGGILPIISGLDALLTIGLLIATWYGWHQARYVEIFVTTLLIAFLIPNPDTTSQFDTAMYIAPVLALILGGARWVVGTAVVLLLILLIRTGGQGVYADSGSLIVYGVAIGGMALASWVTTTAQKSAETNALKAQKQAKELARYNDELIALNQLSAQLQLCSTVAEATLLLAETLQKLFPGLVGRLLLYSQQEGERPIIRHWGGYVPESVDNPYDHNVLAFPLRTKEETLGLLTLHYTAELSFDTQQLLRAISDQAALALANLLLREQLTHQALRDPLTGLFNRRSMEASFSRELHRAQRTQRILGVMLFDIDHFKVINDTLGHAAGDMVLRTISTLILEKARASDIVCRYGGEELLLIFPDTTLEGLQRRAEDLRVSIERLAVPFGDQMVVGVTVSVGLALYPLHGTTPKALIQAADDALYQAKANGRNCVRIAA